MSRRGSGNAVADGCVNSCQASGSRKILGKTGTAEEQRKGEGRSKTSRNWINIMTSDVL